MKRTAKYLSIFGVAVALLTAVAIPITAAAPSSDYLVIKVINQDQFEGNWKQFKGELKKKWGKFTDDDLLVIEGNYDKFEGKLQERYGDQKAKVHKWTDEWFETHGK